MTKNSQTPDLTITPKSTFINYGFFTICYRFLSRAYGLEENRLPTVFPGSFFDTYDDNTCHYDCGMAHILP